MANGGADDERFEAMVRALARALPYPPTPDLARGWRAPARVGAGRFSPRLAWVIVILLVMVGSLLAVPQVRAALIEFFQLGGVRIYFAPTPTPTMPPFTGTPRPILTPRISEATPTPTFLPSLLNLSGETTLEDAEAKAGFSLLLPPDDGPPDRIFYQNIDRGPLVILVWLDPADPNRVRLSLHQMRCEVCVEKIEPTILATTTVNGQFAIWAEGPYLVRLNNGDMDFRRLVEGQVLIWEADGITYRLETELSMEEAVAIAESLK
jgi:hypothetical protein